MSAADRAASSLRHLVTHTNGLPDYEFFEAHLPPGRVRHTPDLLAVLAKTGFEPSFRPSSRFEYGNLGFDLAGLIVERVTGQGFPAFLGQRFLDPLGMRHSFARPALFADWPGVRTLAYRPPPRQDEIFDVFEGEGFIGGSNLYFTARDLHRWVSAFATGRGLPDAVLQAAAAPVLLDGKESGIRKGNWYCDGEARCYYTGNLNGFYGFAYWDRGTGDTAVYLTNSTFQGWETPAFERALIQAVRGSPSTGPAGPESLDVYGRPHLCPLRDLAGHALPAGPGCRGGLLRPARGSRPSLSEPLSRSRRDARRRPAVTGNAPWGGAGSAGAHPMTAAISSAVNPSSWRTRPVSAPSAGAGACGRLSPGNPR